MEPLRIGLAGCGRIARLVHLDTLMRLPKVRLVAIADSDLTARTEAVQRAPGARFYTAYNDLLDDPQLEAVVICLPTHLHAGAAIAAFERGKHVYLEKPIATRLVEADALLESWQRSGRVGMVGFNYRFNPLYRGLRKAMQAGVCGRLTAMRMVFSAAPRELPEWKRRRATGGGALLDQASHHFDLLRYLTGREVHSLQAELSSQRGEQDSATIQLTLDDGLPVQLLVSLSAVDEDRVEVYGEQGKLTADRLRGLFVEQRGPVLHNPWLEQLKTGVRGLVANPTALRRLINPAFEPSYGAALAAFALAARGMGEVAPDLQDGYTSLALVAAAEQAAESGTRIEVEVGHAYTPAA